ncbi:MAG: FHA domain-containing protein [Acidobacteria bacterium]|nr:FHA domain-containing protein [Acidobacteriota bacterium]MCW5971244.1 FHA domain-containing protein [Blastocatellales bacterium]
MIKCYHCGTENLDGSEYCDECGTRLVQASMRTPTYVPPQPPPPPPAFTRDPVTPKTAVPFAPPPPPPPAPRSGSMQAPTDSGRQAIVSPPPLARPSSNSHAEASSHSGPSAHAQPAPASGAPVDARARLVIQRGGKVGKEFPLAAEESLIGRWDADGGIFPDVDLDQDDPEAKVSRRHARIHCLNSQYLIEDLGSTNGTFVNRGPRLLPGTRQPLKNGDEIIVGKTFLKFVLN